MARITIVTGLPEEADAFLPGLGTRSIDGSLTLRALAHAGHDIHLATARIGKVAATTAAVRLATRFGCDLLMVIGTAGKLAPVAGDCFWLAQAVQHDYGAARGDGFAHYDAGAWPIGPAALSPFSALAQPGGLNLPETMIASGDCFVESAAHAAHLHAALGATLVDMETAAVAQVAALLGLPWCAIKATTDEADEDGADSFMANLASAARRAATAAEDAIARLTFL